MTNVTAVEFTKDTISSIRDELDDFWHSYYGDSFSFWYHEIEKHYSCLTNKNGVID